MKFCLIHITLHNSQGISDALHNVLILSCSTENISPGTMNNKRYDQASLGGHIHNILSFFLFLHHSQMINSQLRANIFFIISPWVYDLLLHAVKFHPIPISSCNYLNPICRGINKNVLLCGLTFLPINTQSHILLPRCWHWLGEHSTLT